AGPANVAAGREEACPPRELPEAPLLDYQAKDYASFRRLLLDLLPQLNPDFVERNPSDLGIALLELLAYEGDHLSYFQDAVANEAFLETARRRISARRHARLVDYRMHDGRNAWTAIHVRVGDGGPGTLEGGDFVRLEERLGPATGAPPDADPAHRQLVRLEEAEETSDPLYGATLSGGALVVRGLADPELPLLRVRWRRQDALSFPLCLS